MAVKRLNKIAIEFNIGTSTLVEFLQKKGMPDANPNSKINDETYNIILKKFSSDKGVKNNAEKMWSEKQKKDKNEVISLQSAEKKEEIKTEKEVIIKESIIQKNPFKIMGHIDLENKKSVKKEPSAEEQNKQKENPKMPEAVFQKKENNSDKEKKVFHENKKTENEHVKKENHIEKPLETVNEKKEPIIHQNLEDKKEPIIHRNLEDKKEPLIHRNLEDKKEPLIHRNLEDKKEPIIHRNLEDKKEPLIHRNLEEKKEGEIKILGTIDLDNLNQKTRPSKKTKKEKEAIRKQRLAEQRKTVHPVDSENKPKEHRTHNQNNNQRQSSNQNPNQNSNPNQKQNPNTNNNPNQKQNNKPNNNPNQNNTHHHKRDDRKPNTDKPRSEQNRTEHNRTNNRTEHNRTDNRTDNRTVHNRNEHHRRTDPRVESKNTPVVEKIEEDNKDFLETKITKLSGPTVIGKIDLPVEKKSIVPNPDNKKRKKRKRIVKKVGKEVVKETDVELEKDLTKIQQKNQAKIAKVKKKFVKNKKIVGKVEVKEEDIKEHIKETYAKLTANKQKAKTSAKHRKEKRDLIERKKQDELAQQEENKSIIKVTEFVTANELANMMDISVTDVISTCMSLGLFVSINQRLDAETIVLVAEEFNFNVEFISVEIQEAIESEEDAEEDLKPRSPIITVMGHVDHGKTSLLDFIRHTNVIAGEAGGITQHIGAYKVRLKSGQDITFLDTPGHEAFTAMRARGAKVTDIVIIVVAADDNVMPQTIEAINHASAAGVPIIFAINKIDKPNANPEKIKKELAAMNYLVEEWGGKYQSADISAKQGINVDGLLELVQLEAEILNLRANPNRKAKGTVIESTLDKGRGYLTTILVKTGTMHVGDVILAGRYTGKVKAMFNERNKAVESAGPSDPVLILGLDGAPQAGDEFNVMGNEKEARSIANKREQLKREQSLRTNKHITLDEIGRRIAIGNFQELNIIVKGDVDGSIEALSDSLQKLSTGEIQVNIIHKAVGQISESDVTLATASNAIIIGFQVRPSSSARRLAETEGIDIRLYSVIYDAIGELKDAMEGMLSPEIKEQIMGSAEIREIFKIGKVGTIAGCMVKEGKIVKTASIRLIRDGIVILTGRLGSLKRFKDDVKEVKNGFECGLNIDKYNDIKIGDIIEAFETVEVKRTLK